MKKKKIILLFNEGDLIRKKFTDIGMYHLLDAVDVIIEPC